MVDEDDQTPATGDASSASPVGAGMDRVDYAVRTLGGDERSSGYGPGWWWRAPSIDADAVQWRVIRTPDGGMSHLVLQIPYGSQYDVLRDRRSVILSSIADALEKDGHGDDAAIIRNDRVTSMSWRAASCMAVDVGYGPEPADDGLLAAAATYEPYPIRVIHPELLASLAPDEIGGGTDAKWSRHAMVEAITGMILAVGAAGSGSTLLGIAAVCAFVSTIITTGRALIARSRHRQHGRVISRPGFILTTSTGWMVWQYDSGASSTPRDLAVSARAALDSTLTADDGPAASPQPVVGESYVSRDGRMVWFSAPDGIPGAPALSALDAARYLSLIVKTRPATIPQRSYPGSEPTLVLGVAQRETGTEVHTLSGRVAQTASPEATDWSSAAVLRRVGTRGAASTETTRLKGMQDALESHARSIIGSISGIPGDDSTRASIVSAAWDAIHLGQTDTTGLDEDSAQAMMARIDATDEALNAMIASTRASASSSGSTVVNAGERALQVAAGDDGSDASPAGGDTPTMPVPDGAVPSSLDTGIAPDDGAKPAVINPFLL